jgi:hypothetical protein
MYHDIIRWCMDGMQNVKRPAVECRVALCSSADIVMEVLWAVLLGQEVYVQQALD